MNVSEYISQYGEGGGLIVFPGFDTAFLGIGFLEGKPYSVYNRKKIISILKKQSKMTSEESEEYFSYNFDTGDTTPIFLDTYHQKK